MWLFILPVKITTDVRSWETQLLLIWAPFPLLASYPGISLLCRVYFEPSGNYLEGNSQAQEINRHFIVALFTGGPPNIWHTFPHTCLMESCVIKRRRAAGNCPPSHSKSVVELWSPFFLLNAHIAQVSVLPQDFMFLFCTVCLSSRKDLFFDYFPTCLWLRAMVHLLNALCCFHPCSSLFDGSIHREKRDSEK